MKTYGIAILDPSDLTLGPMKPRPEPEARKPVRRPDGIVIGTDGKWSSRASATSRSGAGSSSLPLPALGCGLPLE